MKKILITGGAGFAGSNLAIRFKQSQSDLVVVCLDNLKRRGSELALKRLRQHGIEFVHGDVRIKQDLLELGAFDLIIDCSAEPSVLAGVGGSPAYVIDTNFTGTINCLELARIHSSKVIFLSTSRVYPVAPLNSLNFVETESRFELSSTQNILGASEFGIAEQFTLEGARSLYGASKLASELFVQEYIDTYGIQAVVNRCGVLTGPWQMGKVDQGVVVLWIAKHFFKKELAYIGYGGTGKQVRDLLHIDDLFDLLEIQLRDFTKFNGNTYNVGGGNGVSVSLQELTILCENVTGNKIPIKRVLENRPNDLISYVTDARKIMNLANWSPKRKAPNIIQEITEWIAQHKVDLEPILA